MQSAGLAVRVVPDRMPPLSLTAKVVNIFLIRPTLFINITRRPLSAVFSLRSRNTIRYGNMSNLKSLFMKGYYENENKRYGLPSRQIVIKRLTRLFPERSFDTDEELFDILAEYDAKLDEKYDKLRKDQSSLASLFMSNPKMGGFISDVVEGEDPLIACVRYFGKDMLECAGDERRMAEIRKENDEYLARMNRVRETEKEINENWKRSETAIERFKESKGMSEGDFEIFLSKVCRICEQVFMSEFTYELLDTLYKGINYDEDIDSAQEAGEVKGRNMRIMFDREKDEGDNVPGLKGAASRGGSDTSNLTPIFGLRRRKSVWDM